MFMKAIKMIAPVMISGSRIRTTTYRYLLFLVIVLITVSCNKEADRGVPEAITALTKVQNCNCEPYIDLYTWRNDATYISSCKGPACFCGVAYYDEEGTPLELPAGYSFADFLDEARFERNIWTCVQ
jgi:hypothetical protein